MVRFMFAYKEASGFWFPIDVEISNSASNPPVIFILRNRPRMTNAAKPKKRARASARARITIRSRSEAHVQPAANLFRKHWKSLAFRTGGAVLPSQLAVGSWAANLFRKHWKSLAFRIGGAVLLSQLA